MIDLSLFKRPAFVGAQVTAFAISSTLFAMFLYITLYLQNILGLSPLQTGVRFLPLSLLAFVVAPLAGRLSTRLPIRALIGTGLALVRRLDVPDEPRHRPFDLARAAARASSSAASGSAWSTRRSPRPPSRPSGSSAAGMASGINNTFRQVGIATGIAALGAIFQTQVHSKVVSALAGLPNAGGIAHSFSNGQQAQAIAAAPAGLCARTSRRSPRPSFVSGFHDILIVGGIVAPLRRRARGGADPPAGLRRERGRRPPKPRPSSRVRRAFRGRAG